MTADTLSLPNKVAIVTGSGRENGIGAAIAASLARNGASVVINYISDATAPRAQKVAEGIKAAGGKVAVIQGDVSKPGDAKALVEGTLKAFNVGKIDILVNNAGVGRLVNSLDQPVDEVRKFLNVNIEGAINMVREVIPYIAEGGRIINITSIASKKAAGLMAVYSATKAGLDVLSYAWAEEFGKSHGITVNSVAPGPVITDMAGQDLSEGLVNALISQTRAANRLGTAEDIADAVLLLVSEKARWITGQVVSVSGGITGGL